MTRHIDISLSRQTLSLRDGDRLLGEYPVSTARNGAGERDGSECTPRGRHVIADRIGAGCAVNTVFVGRRPTGEIYQSGMRRRFPERDWILTRILRLRGLEPGLNCGGEVDTYNRYIYIHGAPDEVEMGTPGSHGCIRMRNRDVLELFEQVRSGTPVSISE